jgi:hypothetical protein
MYLVPLIDFCGSVELSENDIVYYYINVIDYGDHTFGFCRYGTFETKPLDNL